METITEFINNTRLAVAEQDPTTLATILADVNQARKALAELETETAEALGEGVTFAGTTRVQVSRPGPALSRRFVGKAKVAGAILAANDLDASEGVAVVLDALVGNSVKWQIGKLKAMGLDPAALQEIVEGRDPGLVVKVEA